MTSAKLTVGTAYPAVAPYFEGGDPYNGRGFEGAMAYAIGGALGFAPSAVAWTVVPRNEAFAPGPKSFDFDINQISITGSRAKQVDFSVPYYATPQAVVVGGAPGTRGPGPSPRCPTPGSACGGAPPASAR